MGSLRIEANLLILIDELYNLSMIIITWLLNWGVLVYIAIVYAKYHDFFQSYDCWICYVHSYCWLIDEAIQMAAYFRVLPLDFQIFLMKFDVLLKISLFIKNYIFWDNY